MGAHVQNEIGKLIYLRHFFRSAEVASKKRPVFRVRNMFWVTMEYNDHDFFCSTSFNSGMNQDLDLSRLWKQVNYAPISLKYHCLAGAL